jgi:hypothetical protein
VTKFAHRARLDLADTFSREVHLGTYVFERSDLSGPVETEAHAKNLLFALVEGL